MTRPGPTSRSMSRARWLAAVACASSVFVLMMSALLLAAFAIVPLLASLGPLAQLAVAGSVQAVTFGVPVGAALLAYHGLRPLTPLKDGHTWCGHCGYLLKGLTEPRCPECGVTI